MLLKLLALAALAAQGASAAVQEGARPAAAAGAAEAPWTRYTYPGEELSVELPAAPAVSRITRVIPDPEGHRIGQARVFGVYSDGVVFVVASYDHPRETESFDFFAGYIWGGRWLAAAGDVRLGELDGRAYRYTYPFEGAARVFRAKRHAYLLQVMSDEKGHGRAFGRFLDSLALGGKPAGERIPDETPAGPFAPEPPRPARTSATPRPAPEGDGPFGFKDVSRRALIVFKPEPVYTDKARRNKVRGVVRLRLVLAPTGKVAGVEVVKHLPDGLTEKAVEAARRILFFPAVIGDRRVSQYAVLDYTFDIQHIPNK